MTFGPAVWRCQTKYQLFYSAYENIKFTADALNGKLKIMSSLCCHQGVRVFKTFPRKPSYDFGIM